MLSMLINSQVSMTKVTARRTMVTTKTNTPRKATTIKTKSITNNMANRKVKATTTTGKYSISRQHMDLANEFC